MTANDTNNKVIQLNAYTKGNITIRQSKEGAEQVWLQIGDEKARLVSREIARDVWDRQNHSSAR